MDEGELDVSTLSVNSAGQGPRPRFHLYVLADGMSGVHNLNHGVTRLGSFSIGWSHLHVLTGRQVCALSSMINHARKFLRGME